MILDGGKGVLAQGPLLSSLVFLSASGLVPHLVDLSPGETHNMASPHTSDPSEGKKPEKPTKEATVFYDLISEVTCHHFRQCYWSYRPALVQRGREQKGVETGRQDL